MSLANAGFSRRSDVSLTKHEMFCSALAEWFWSQKGLLASVLLVLLVQFAGDAFGRWLHWRRDDRGNVTLYDVSRGASFVSLDPA